MFSLLRTWVVEIDHPDDDFALRRNFSDNRFAIRQGAAASRNR
jgi:hypothetical protein